MSDIIQYSKYKNNKLYCLFFERTSNLGTITTKKLIK